MLGPGTTLDFGFGITLFLSLAFGSLCFCGQFLLGLQVFVNPSRFAVGGLSACGCCGGVAFGIRFSRRSHPTQRPFENILFRNVGRWRSVTLPARIDTLQESVERFAAAGDKVRAAWLLAEAEHYMRIANAQLGLAGDVDVAQTSLGLADDTLRELNEPRLIPVRKLLAKEINDLKAVPRPHTEGIVLTLGSLADSLEGLPLKNAMPADTINPGSSMASPMTLMMASRMASSAPVFVNTVISNVPGPQTSASPGYIHHQLVREVLGGASGTSGVFPATTSAGSLYTHQYSHYRKNRRNGR